MSHQHHHGADHHHHEAPNNCPNRYQEAFEKFDLHVHDEHALEAVARLLQERKAAYDTPQDKRIILSSIELTSLKVTDSSESILQWVEKINDFIDAHPDLPHPAGICTYPRFASVVAGALEVEGMHNVSVVGGFPASQTFAEIKTAETSLAVLDGADEVDCVLPVGALLSEDYETVADEISEIKEAAGTARLKVILETGALPSAALIKQAAIMAIYSGADFIKTSTGKVTPAATPLAAYVMCTTIREYAELTGTRIGFKAAGGISTPDDALTYYTIAREVLGPEWMDEGLFRIGASSLAGRLVAELGGADHCPY